MPRNCHFSRYHFVWTAEPKRTEPHTVHAWSQDHLRSFQHWIVRTSKGTKRLQFVYIVGRGHWTAVKGLSLGSSFCVFVYVPSWNRLWFESSWSLERIIARWDQPKARVEFSQKKIRDKRGFRRSFLFILHPIVKWFIGYIFMSFSIMLSIAKTVPKTAKFSTLYCLQRRPPCLIDFSATVSTDQVVSLCAPWQREQLSCLNGHTERQSYGD